MNNIQNNKTDIAICGAGPVGLAFALLLVKRGILPSRITLIDAKTIEQSKQDPRTIALSHGSQQILENLGAWPIACNHILQIHVSRQGHFGRTLIDHQEQHVPALGYVTRYADIISALDACATKAQLSILRPTKITGLTENADDVTIHTDNNEAINAQLVIQAEGGIFSDQTPKNIHKKYNQVAIVAHVNTSKPNGDCAFERFTKEGPLALLPQDDGYAMVWCCHPDTAEHLLALNDQDFLQALQKTFGQRVGKFQAIKKRAAYPLGKNIATDTAKRIIKIGNAAQTLHPVAGQGLNLGLRDATVLARILSKQTTAKTGESFYQERKFDRYITTQLTDNMARAFCAPTEGSPIQTLLGFSLGLLDVHKPIKNWLANKMMFGIR